MASGSIAPGARASVIMLAAAIALFIIVAVALFIGALPTRREPAVDLSAYRAPGFDARVVGFDDVPGWRADNVAAAFPAYLRSCGAIENREPDAPANPLENLGESSLKAFAGPLEPWRAACADARRLSAMRFADDAAYDDAVRVFFESVFAPLEIRGLRPPLEGGPAAGAAPLIETTGKFTGYFEPAYPARLEQAPGFDAPLYGRPRDLVEVDLGAFRDDLKGERIAGRVEGGRLVPYADRRAVNEGAIDGQARVIAWLDPNDLFFLQIQGSGRLLFADGETLRVGYAAQNGHPYTTIGRVLRERGAMALEDITMASIRQWLSEAGPDAARELREQNASYVFFTELDAPPEGLGPLGAQGLPLTPERSLAVDRRFHPMGAPVFVDIEPIEAGGAPIRRLMIAQDTGGAIRGPVRGDVFWGAGETAAARAGAMNAEGRMFVLVPIPVAERIRAQGASS